MLILRAPADGAMMRRAGMNSSLAASATALGLFVAMMACLEGGFRIARRHKSETPDVHRGVAAIEAATFALLGLLLAFAFSGAMSRLDERRKLIVRETNAISAVHDLVDLMPPESRVPIRMLIRHYIDTRLGTNQLVGNQSAVDRSFAEAAVVHHEIWTRVIAELPSDPSNRVAQLLLPALDEMGTVAATRAVYSRPSLPGLILTLLLLMALLSALLAGYALTERNHRSLLHMILYAATIALTLYTILDLDNPRIGFIRVDAADRAMQALADSMR